MKTSLTTSNMKNYLALRMQLVCVLMLFSWCVLGQYPSGSPAAINGKLKVSGTKLVNECGNAVQLRGMSSHGLQWFPGCYNTSSLDALVNDWKIDVFRLAMYVQEQGYVTNPSYWKSYIDGMVDECGKRGIYCIIDWHVLNPGDPNANINDARDFWSYMSAKHGSKKHVLYEICNEPNGVSWSTVKNYANDIIPRIRANDPNTVIIVGTPNWSQDVDVAASDKLSFSNVMYTLHFYSGTHGQSFRDKANTAMSRGAAVFVTEFGTSQASGDGGPYLSEAENWISWMAQNSISWCNWSFSDKAEVSAALNSGSCGSNSWNSTTQSGSWVKGKLTSADNFNCPGGGGGGGGNQAPTVSITSPANNATFTAPASITINATASDADGTVSKVDFYNGSTLLVSDASSPYSYTWSNVAAGTYTITVKATDNSGAVTTSSAITITVKNPAVPQGPYSGTAIAIPGKVEAENYDVGGSSVAYNDADAGNSGNQYRTDDVDIEASTDAGAGYDVGWTAAGEWLEYTVNVTASGSYNFNVRLAATATGKTMHVEMNGTNVTGTISVPNTGGWQTWQTVTIPNVNLTAGNNQIMRVYFETDGINLNYVEVAAPAVSNQPPAIAITSPANNATFTAPASVTINANASDVDGTVSKVDFYNGTTLLGSDATSPYSYTWSNVAAGTYTITAKATDNSGATTTSTAVTITVTAIPNTPPTVAITGPADNASFPEPASITITASASDADGTVSKVDFYNGTTLLGSDATSPYSYAWNNVAAGTYTITAKATDNSGAVTTSTAITVVVTGTPNTAPVITITSPANNANFVAPATITINADASDADGSVSKVDFYNGTTLLGSDATAPYSYTWSNVGGGTYTITAKATDNRGAVTTSAAITVVVKVLTQGPYGGTPASIPGKVEAENYDLGGSGVGYYDSDGGNTGGQYRTDNVDIESTTDAGGGYNVGWSANGEWLKYTVNVTATGSYDFNLRVASALSGKTMHLEMNGNNVSGTITIPNTGGWQTWQTITVPSVSLTAGDNQVLRIYYEADGINVNYINVVPGAPNQAPAVSIINPANNASFTEPASIAITATASDADGSVSKVEFYSGTKLLGSATTAPYSFTWTNVAAGTYTITAVATDNKGASTTSAPVSVTVLAASASVSIHAEYACYVDGVLNETDHAGFLGTGYVNTFDETGSAVSWNISSQSNQTVGLSIRYAHATASGRNMSLQVNGVTQIAAVSFPSTGSATTWLTANVQVTLAAGLNVVKLVSLTSSGSPYLDELIFATNSVTIASCATPVVIQGESACTVDGVLNETATVGYRGTGYLNSNDATGASATWSVNSPASQTVDLSIRFAHSTGAGRNMSLSVNGVTQIANVDFPATWGFWGTSNMKVTLSAGANTIKLVSLTDAGSPYIDELEFFGNVTAGTCSTSKASAASAPQAIVGPNPSMDIFTLAVAETATSVVVTDAAGTVVFTAGTIQGGDQISFGKDLPNGFYILKIIYASGRVETKSILKTL